VYTAVRANGKPAVLLNITRQPSGNTVAVANGVAAEIDQLKSKLPAGVHLEPFYDQSELVRESILSVRDAILIGLVLACIILFLFLHDWTSSLVAGLVIPVTVAVTILFLRMTGQSFNLMTLGGLAAAIGLVIDDAIVVVENIAVHREAGESRIGSVRKAIREISRPLIFSTITPVIVFLPLVSVTQVTGSFFRALAVTMTVALLTSLLLALTFTPALSMQFGSKGHAKKAPSLTLEQRPGFFSRVRQRGGEVFRRLPGYHEGALAWSLQRPFLLTALCAVLMIAGYFSYKALGSDLLPEMDEGAFVLDYFTPAGTSLTETNRILDHVDRILRGIPEVSITSRRTGLQMGLAAVTEANTGDFTVRLKADRSRAIDEVIADARAQIHAAEPSVDMEFTQVLQDMIGDLSNSPEPIQIKLFSNDQNLLLTLGPRVQQAIAKIPGVVDTENGVDNTISGPATSFQIDPVIAGRLGFTPTEIAEDATSILDGLPANNPLISGGRPYTIRVRLPEANRASLDAIQNTVFNSSSGHTATLSAMATMTQLPPQNEIRRENLQQVIQVSGRLEGSDLGGTMERVRATVSRLQIPSSVRVEYGGTYQEQQRSFADLARVLVLALALVFAVLLVEFRNFAAPISILISSVLSLAGVVFALLITGTNFNVSSFMGLIMVIGIVAKNGILLLDADEQLRAGGMGARQATLQAAERRRRPILMTAIATICGMFPLALALGAGSQMLQPLAIAVIGGLSISVVLSLVVTPMVYYQFGRIFED
jgi:multidrug efflux pump subunit AcrB